MRQHDVYMTHCNWAGAVFVKTLEYFRSQGGFTEDWGKAWVPVVATSIEDARKKACEVHPGAKPYKEQAQP